MNPSKTLFKELDELGFHYIFYKNYDDEVEFADADEMVVSNFDVDSEFYCVAKSIKLPKKKEVTIEYVLDKLFKVAEFTNLSTYFSKILSSTSINVYPTSYGIGVFRVFGNIQNEITRVETLLNENNIQFTNEFSDARWVYRFKISKSKDNIERIKQVIK